MMKILFALIKATLVVVVISLLSACCKSDSRGDYLLDSLAKSYVLDTGINTFLMVDSRGFKESFIRNQGEAYVLYEGGNIDRCGVQFRVEYFFMTFSSSVNRYWFEYTVWAGVSQEDGPRLWINWNNDMWLDYDLLENKVLGEDEQVRVNQLDSLTVRGRSYTRVIVVDFYDRDWKLYIAPPYGLIKIVRPDGIYSERIP